MRKSSGGAGPTVELVRSGFFDNHKDDEEPKHTFSKVDLGTAEPNRAIILLASGMTPHSWINGAKLKSASIAGIAATNVVTAFSGNSGSEAAGIFIAKVPTGTTGNVSLVFADDLVVFYYSLFVVHGLQSFAAVDTGSYAAKGSVANMSGAINCPAGGIVFGLLDSSRGAPYTWNGLTQRTNPGGRHASAYDIFSAEQAKRPVSVGITNKGSEGRNALVLASFK
jgi:hypothetical protein